MAERALEQNHERSEDLEPKKAAPEQEEEQRKQAIRHHVGGNDALGRKENLLEPFFADMQAVAGELVPQFSDLGLHFRPQVLLATALQEADARDPLNARSFDNGLGIMQITPYQGRLDDNVARALGWDNSKSVEYNIAHSRWRNARANITAGALTMLNKARAIRRQVPAIWEQMDEPHRWRATLFAYNAGEGAAARALRNGGPNAPMISTYTGPDGKRHSHDYTQEIQSKFDYVEAHDPFSGGGGQGQGQGQGQGNGQTQEPQVTAGVPTADLQEGDRGSEVQKLQEALVQLGYLTQADVNTGLGIFGPKTEAAVKRFQAEHHVPTTGYFGPQTRRALTQALRGH